MKFVSHDSISYKVFDILKSYRQFKKTYDLLKESQYWDMDKIEEYQLNQLESLINHSYNNVPYYKKIFDEREIKPKDIQEFEDLRLLPFLTKELIKKNINQLKAKNYPTRSFEYVTTGGSTGTPLGFYYEKGVNRAQEWAFIKNIWDRVGYKFQAKNLILKGNIVKSSQKGKFWENSLFGRVLVLSSYHLSIDNIPKYIDKIKKFNPEYIQAYPSTITIIAKFMKENDDICKFNNLKAILCGSENMYPDQREIIQDVFNCRVFRWYGHSERAVLASECEYSTDYHICPEYGIFELVKEDGDVIHKKNDNGLIVGTSLTNYAMPFIRYKTDDMAILTNNSCKCERKHQKIRNVRGRWKQELIVGKNKKLIPITALNMHSDIFDNIEQFQFYQDTVGKINFRIVKKESYTNIDSKKIMTELLRKLGNDFKVELSFLDEIPRTSRGKYMFLIQELSTDFDLVE